MYHKTYISSHHYFDLLLTNYYLYLYYYINSNLFEANYFKRSYFGNNSTMLVIILIKFEIAIVIHFIFDFDNFALI